MALLALSSLRLALEALSQLPLLIILFELSLGLLQPFVLLLALLEALEALILPVLSLAPLLQEPLFGLQAGLLAQELLLLALLESLGLSSQSLLAQTGKLVLVAFLDAELAIGLVVPPLGTVARREIALLPGMMTQTFSTMTYNVTVNLVTPTLLTRPTVDDSFAAPPHHSIELSTPAK